MTHGLSQSFRPRHFLYLETAVILLKMKIKLLWLQKVASQFMPYVSHNIFGWTGTKHI